MPYLRERLTVLVRLACAWGFLCLLPSLKTLTMSYDSTAASTTASTSLASLAPSSTPARPPSPSVFTYHFTRISQNRKTGPMPVTTTSANTCPPSCSFKGQGCYAESGPLALHWKAVTAGRRGGSFDELLAQISGLRRHTLWRHNQAGDLTPSSPGVIDAELLLRLAQANRGRRGFAYTHFAATPHNLAAIGQANAMGFTVNLSAETLVQADAYADLGVAPVVVVLPAEAIRAMKTPAGRQVIVCPASLGNRDCMTCSICQTDRKAIVGFPAHGSGAAKVQAVFWQGRRH